MPIPSPSAQHALDAMQAIVGASACVIEPAEVAGSEGTLGIITAAVLKLVPQQRSASVAFVAVEHPAAAVQLLGEAKRIAGQTLTAFELISRPALESGLVLNAAVASSGADAQTFWRIREEISDAQTRHGGSVRCDVSAEHGVGVAKREALLTYKSPVEIELMWQIKRALDPKNLLNPAKVLPVVAAKN